MSFSLTVLGTGAALPTLYRGASAHVLNVHEHFFLIDCGEATQIQIKKFKIKSNRINHIFISHLHGDHYYGLPGLLASFSLMGRKKELHLFAHPQLQNALNAFLLDTELGYPLIFHPLQYEKPQVILNHKHLTVTSFPLKHRTETCGFLFKEKQRLRSINGNLISLYQIPVSKIQAIKEGADFETKRGEIIPNQTLTTEPPAPRSYAYCSDTAYTESIIPVIKDVDLLYHEATFDHDLIKYAKQTGHSTAVHAAIIAQKANAKQLLIGHFSSRYKSPAKHLEQTKHIFSNTIALKDGDVFELPEQKRKNNTFKP